MDVSADLTELGRTTVTVISSGVKSILDIRKTLEYLVTFDTITHTLNICTQYIKLFNFFSTIIVKNHQKNAERSGILMLH